MPTVRELPPTRLSVNVQPPSGQGYRWGADEPKAQNVPSGLSFSTSAPGGFESCSLTLPRRPRLAYPDLELMSNVTVSGAGAQIAWEGRIEGVPRTSGNEAAVSPNIVGWQAHLEDDTSAKMVYVDRDQSRWGEASTQRQIDMIGFGFDTLAGSWNQGFQDTGSTTPGIAQTISRIRSGIQVMSPEPWYYSGGSAIGKIRYGLDSNSSSANRTSRLVLAANDRADGFGGAVDTGTDHDGADVAASSGSVTATTATKPYAFFQWYDSSGGVTSDTILIGIWYSVRVFGYGVTERGTSPDEGVYASDVVAHALGFAPRLRYTTGSGGSVTASTFVIPQLAFWDPTTAAEIISAANRYHLRDWFVWEGATAGQPTFYYHPRGERGRAWRARVGPSQLAETGTAIERAWNGVIVRYQDVDGSTKTVGPTNASTDATSADLLDTDPLNPLNRAGIRRWQTIDMAGVSTVAGATELGRRFLVEAKAYDTSGQAQIVGHCEDDRGVMRPAWQIRAGDTITFVDAADTSPRRVIKTTYSDDSKTNAVDLDAPPDALAALLERLQVVLVPFGL